MKWILIAWWIVGPIDGPATEYTKTHLRQEFSSLEACAEAMDKWEQRVTAIENFRGAAGECRSRP